MAARDALARRGSRARATVVFEERIGGRVFEQSPDGELQWADVLVFEPPHRFVIAWKVNRAWPAATEVEVTFTAEGAGTRVDLEHRGWDRLGAVGPDARGDYDRGWVGVIGRYEEAANH